MFNLSNLFESSPTFGACGLVSEPVVEVLLTLIVLFVIPVWEIEVEN